jgi:integrase
MTMLALEPQPANERWLSIMSRSPVLAATCQGYLAQISLTARPATVASADRALRFFGCWLNDHDPTVVALRQLNRRHIEGYKLFLVSRENGNGQPLKKSTINNHLGMLRVIIERLIEWDHPDAPPRNPIFGTDLPKLDEPLPKFLDDEAAAKFMAAATRMPIQWRLVIEMLARTGLRIGEFCALQADAIVTLGDTNWLRVPVGKLHTDRYVPLLPILVELHDRWRAEAGPDDTGLLLTNQGRKLDRYSVSRAVARCARIAGIGHVHPHQLRHTLATQAINNGMSLEAIAAMLGHRSMRMTLVYARIADRTVADEYFAAADKVDALYNSLEDPMTLSDPHANELAKLSPETTSFAKAHNNTLREFTALDRKPKPRQQPQPTDQPTDFHPHPLTTSPT